MKGRLVSRRLLAATIRERMYRLLDSCFQGVSRSSFADDLADKDWVILLEDRHHRLVGFSTFGISTTTYGGQPFTVVFSGDTIIEPASWGSFALPATWIASVLTLHRRRGHGRLMWLLICSGYRTYRFLPVLAREYFPSCDRQEPPFMQSLRHHLAGERFGRAYDRLAGVVRLEHPQVLRPGLAGIPEQRLHDPHVAFFTRRNPGHLHGDELVCLAEVSEANLTRAGRRLLQAGRRDLELLGNAS